MKSNCWKHKRELFTGFVFSVRRCNSFDNLHHLCYKYSPLAACLQKKKHIAKVLTDRKYIYSGNFANFVLSESTSKLEQHLKIHKVSRKLVHLAMQFIVHRCSSLMSNNFSSQEYKLPFPTLDGVNPSRFGQCSGECTCAPLLMDSFWDARQGHERGSG